MYTELCKSYYVNYSKADGSISRPVRSFCLLESAVEQEGGNVSRVPEEFPEKLLVHGESMPVGHENRYGKNWAQSRKPKFRSWA